MFKTLLNQVKSEKRPLFLDGAMGTMLISSGLPVGKRPELLNIDSPDLIQEIHYKYLMAGSDIVFTNTFGANTFKFNGEPYLHLISAGIECAKKAVSRAKKGLIALDIGSLGHLLEPMGSLSFEEAYNAYAEIVNHAKDDIDLFAVETLSDLMEAKIAVLAIKENSDKPIILTMSFDEDGRTFSGCSIESMVVTLEGLGVDAIGLNCSLGPYEIEPLVKRLLDIARVPVILKPNAGLPSLVNGETSYTLSADKFARKMASYVDDGVQIIGGCCGTTDEFILFLKNLITNVTQKVTSDIRVSAVASATNYLTLDQPRIVGERINPTGKPLMKAAILNQDFNFVIKQAVEQVSAGAQILDVNMGLPNTDELSSMLGAIKHISSVVDTPLQIDSSDPAVIESALRHYCGKPIVNSVNGDDNTLNTILPLVKKYGAMVIGLTLDKRGVPQSAQARIDIAKKILKRAQHYGIRNEDIIIDCLTLTAGAEQAQAKETLAALRYVKEELGLKTTLGVSNISFGLPQRSLINKNFLQMALTQGLDLPIINPNIEDNLEAIFSYRLLMNLDPNGQNYIQKYSNFSPPATVQVTPSSVNFQPGQPPQQHQTTPDAHNKTSLEDCIIKSLESEALKQTEILLSQKEGLKIIEEDVIPALNWIGNQYEEKKLFLPQLISCSQVAKAVCDKIKTTLPNSENLTEATILVATVEGDVHDIGKNIVKTVLENYGYNVIDLGKDVPPEIILAAIKKHSPKLLGLSALMTTTVANMAKTILTVKSSFPKLPIAVGGAVLTDDVASEIQADFYTKDPQALVNILREL